MAMSVGSSDGDEDVIASINTTPLVDVMLVLLIIFLITLRVVIQDVKIQLPHAANAVTETKPENIVIAVSGDGLLFWNNQPISPQDLKARMLEKAVQVPQPEVHIRGDREGRYEFVGRVILAIQQSGIRRVGFITNPQRGE